MIKLIDILKEIDKDDMPQVKQDDLQPAIKKILKHAKVTKGIICPLRLKPTQDNLSKDKVEDFVEKIKANNGVEAPLIISNGNYVIDGHHRWAAASQIPVKVPFLRIKLSRDDALKLYNDISKEI